MRRSTLSALIATGALGASAAVAPAAVQAAAPLVAQWSLDGAFEDGVGASTADTGGNGLHLRAPGGTIRLGPTAKFGSGATLGSNFGPMQVGSPLLARQQLTLLAWIKQNGDPGVLRYIAGRGDDGGNCGGSSFAFYTGYPGRPGLTFYTRTTSAVPAESSVIADSPPNSAVYDNQWHLLAGTLDGSTLRFYVDGQLIGAPQPVAAPTNYGFSGSGFYVDGYPVGGCGTSDWPGSIDEVRVYDRALTASEIGRLAAAPAGLFAPELSLDAVPAPAAPTPGPTPPASTGQQISGPGPIAAGPATVAAVAAEKIAKAAESIEGASLKKAPPESLAQVLKGAEALMLEQLKTGATASDVGKAERVKDLTKSESQKIKANDKIQQRLEAMKHGVGVEVQATEGQIVAAVATVAMEKKGKDGKVSTQEVVFAPTLAIAQKQQTANGQVASAEAAMQLPVDNKATAAMTKNDVATAAMAVQAYELGSMSDLTQEMQQRLQSYMANYSKAMEMVSNLVEKKAEAEAKIIENMRGGETKSEAKKNDDLERQISKLEKDANKQEQARDQASKDALAAMKDKLAAAKDNISKAVALSGCLKCSPSA